MDQVSSLRVGKQEPSPSANDLQYISKMNKLNFDLKLEIFHRAQQMAALEKKLERMHEMEEELERMRGLEEELEELREVEENNQRLREQNEKLQLELDKRDQAIHEAVELICQLEAKIEELQADQTDSRPSTARPHSSTESLETGHGLLEVSTPKAQIIVDIPDRTSSKRGTSRPPRKAPSFLREENRSTAALRSLYLSDENKSLRSFSASTMATSMESTTEPESPRLSILSECSYFSPHDVQPAKDGFDQLDRLDELDLDAAQKPVSNANPSENGPEDSGMQESQIDRIKCWIQPQQEPPRPTAPRRRPRAISEVSRGTQIRVDEAFNPMCQSSTFYVESPTRNNISLIFGGRLPPTPDTMCTSIPGARSNSNGSEAAEKSAPDQKMPGSPVSMQRKLGRPRSAGELTQRPSTAVSGLSDSGETTMTDATQHAMSIRGRDEITGLFHSFNYFGRGSSKATRVLGPGSPSNPRLSCYGGDLLFNGEGVEEIVSEMRPGRTPSFNSIASDAQSTQLSPSPSPLTHQDWLEAAKPQSKKERKKSEVQFAQEPKETNVDAAEPSNDAPKCDPPSTDEPQLPRNPPLRLRAWGNNPQQQAADSPPRRRLSLRPRFFSRSGGNSQRQQQQQQDPMSDPVDGPEAPSPVIRKQSDMVVSRHRRADSGPLPANVATKLGTDGGSRPAGNRAIPRPFTESRPSSASCPVTSDSSEPRRRGSLFGWMKGGSKEAGPTTTNGSAAPARDKSKSSSLAPAATLDNDSTASKPKVSAPAEEEPEWKVRRRSRRMA